MTTNIAPFRGNAAGFASEDVIPGYLKRNELAEWFNNIIKNQMDPHHPGYTKLNGFPKVLKESLEKTKELYGIQSKFNIDKNKFVDVTSEDFYFAPLFQSYEIWNTMAFQIQNVFRTITSDLSSWEKIIQLHHGPPSPSGRYLISLLLANQVLPIILKSMETNTIEMGRYVNEAKDV